MTPGEPTGMDMSYDEDIEQMATQQVVKDKQENLSKNFSDDEILPDFETEKLVFKESFKEPREVTIERVMVNRFGKPAIVISSDDENFCGVLNLNNLVYMQLKKKFGPKPSAWKDQKVTFESEPFSKDTKKGLMEGWNLKIV